MAQQGSNSGSGGGIDSFFSTNFLSNFKYNTSSTPQQEQEQQSTLSGKQQQFSSSNNNYLSSTSMNNWFTSKPASSSSLFLSNHPSSSSSVNNTHHHFTSTFPITPISRSLSDNTLSPLKSSSSYNNNNNNPAVIDASFSSESSKKKRKRCDEEYENEELEYEHNYDNINNNNNNIDLMREAMILPTNVDNIMMEDSSNNNNNIGEYHDSSMFFPQSLFGNVNSGLMQFSLQHQQPHNAFPLFESEEDMVTSASSTVGSSGSVKKNRMSPQSHLIEFIRDNIMQYLLFHLKLDMRQTHNDIDTCTDDVNMSDSNNNNMVEQDVVDITIPVGLLLDYIVQQAQRLYFNMYEYIRELASSSIKYHCKSATTTDNQKEIELSLACNEFEKVVIEQVHFLLSQIQLMRSTSSNDSQIIPMLKKYDKILPKNFHTLRLVSSTNDDSSIGSNADSFTLDRGIVDESFLFKSSSVSSPPHIHRTSFAQNFDDMKTNSSSLNDISSLLLNTKFKLFY